MKFRKGDIIRKTYFYNDGDDVIFRYIRMKDRINCVGYTLYRRGHKINSTEINTYQIAPNISKIEKLKKSDLMLEEL